MTAIAPDPPQTTTDCGGVGGDPKPPGWTQEERRTLDQLARQRLRNRRFIGYNQEGRRVGESHHRAKYPDELVNQARTLSEPPTCYGWRRIARILQVPGKTVEKWLSYERRAQVPVQWKRVEETP